MKNKKHIKSVISMCTSNAFLLVLTTSPIATIADVPEAYSGELAQDKKLLLQRNDISEKVAISKDGQNVYFTIIGNKGVYCAIAYKAPKFMSDYRLFPNTKTAIGQDGMARITVPLADFTDQDVLFKVVTSDRSDLSSNIKGTREIGAKVMNGQIANISPVQATTSPDLSLATGGHPALLCTKGNVLPGAAARGTQQKRE
jgi:hypothetical protein